MPWMNQIERAVIALALEPHAAEAKLRTLRERVQADPALLDALLHRVVEMQAVRAHLRWIKAAIGRDLALIDVGNVLYFQADTKYTRVVTAEHEALIRRPLRALANELDPDLFWPIHRSTIVNVAAIAGITRNERARVEVRLKSRTERLPVSAAYEHLFRQM